MAVTATKPSTTVLIVDNVLGLKSCPSILQRHWLHEPKRLRSNLRSHSSHKGFLSSPKRFPNACHFIHRPSDKSGFGIVSKLKPSLNPAPRHKYFSISTQFNFRIIGRYNLKRSLLMVWIASIVGEQISTAKTGCGCSCGISSIAGPRQNSIAVCGKYKTMASGNFKVCSRPLREWGLILIAL